MRAIWTGSLSFGLVNIPMRLYSAAPGAKEQINFDLLHKKDKGRIRYARVCTKEDREVPYEELVKGYQRGKGVYVILTEDDFKKANVRKTKTIDVVDFGDEREIDSIYYEKPYYLEPDDNAEKPYVLLRDALKAAKKVGIAKFVLRNREHLGVIKPTGHVIILNQLRYQQDIRSPIGLDIPDFKITEGKEIDIALKLIEQLTQPFRPELYKDTYKEEIKRIIEEKSKGKEPKAIGAEPEPTEVDDLMAKLKESLNKTKSKNQKQKYHSP